MNKFLLSVLSLLMVLSCSSEVSGPSGDYIGLSVSELKFDSASSTDTVLTEGTLWWFCDAECEGDDLQMLYINTASTEDSTEILDYYSQKEAIVEPCPPSLTDGENRIRIQWKWLTIDRIDRTHFTVSVSGNDTGNARTASIGLEAGDYFCRLSVRQN